MSLSSIIGLLMRWTMDFASRSFVEKVKPGWLFRRAKYVGTRIIVLYDGR
jgi:hypothetical protein